ncbi:ankyrin [Karstenula rhodostoma CBS 690.94]|uniref:Ankyrin n=1 Tax=Karstenula rhodostoma CBS 690.94 TaxID=1392251 RepID=A0A9P4P9R7_9PLEO|nr:ankyrin [Karstenula rhodostoma CBS 690.94]
MSPSNLPAAVASAIASGNVTSFKALYEPNIPLEEIARHAALYGQPVIMQWCCDQGWRPPRETLNSEFITSAVYGASPAIWQIMIDHGLDLNAHENEIFGDPLSTAVICGHYDLAKWLLEHGHRSTPKDRSYVPGSSISWTISGYEPNMKMLKLLLDHGHDLKDTGAGVAAADEGNVEALRLLLDHGLNIEDRDMSGYPFSEEDDEPFESQGTALYRACRQGNWECVELLLERGADPLATDLGGTSCLEIARQRGHEDVVWILKYTRLVQLTRGAKSLLGFIKRLFF